MSSPSIIGITLEEAADYVYHPGDTIFGTAWFKSDVDEEVEELSVIFRGLCLVKYSAGEQDIGRTGLKSSEDTIPFFENEKTLLRGRQTLPAVSSHSAPFEFAWSKTTYQDFTGIRVGEQREVFDMKPHELPPSLFFEEGTVSGGIFYELEIRLQQLGKDPVSNILDLNFDQYGDRSSVNELEHRSQTFFANITTGNAPEQRRRSSILKKKDPLKKLKFTLDTSVPKLVPIGQPVPISIQLKHDPIQSALPMITLQTAKVYLISVTHWRFPNPSPNRPKAAYIRVTRQSKLLDGSPGFQEDLMPSVAFDLGQLLSAKIDDVPLPFRSYCIVRSYSLGIHLVIKVGKDTTEHVMNVEIPVTLLSKALPSRSRPPKRKPPKRDVPALTLTPSDVRHELAA
jgi:hypothetical protein